MGGCSFNILVTGANGQLGNEIKYLSQQSNAPYKYFFADSKTVDITNSQSISDFVINNQIRLIINCAAYTAVDKAEDKDQVELCYAVNFEGLEHIGDIAQKQKIKVIHISTDYVFDGTATTPYRESDQTNPQSVYGASKAKGELALLNACEEVIIIRTSWLYSAFGNNFVKTMIRLGKEKESLNVVADQKGTPTNARDLARAILNIIDQRGLNFQRGIYHFSNEGETTWYDFTKAIHQRAGITTTCKVNPIPTSEYPTKAVRPQYSVLDKSKIKSTFNLSIPNWEDSLNLCIDELMTKG